jgi:hypothetical protein
MLLTLARLTAALLIASAAAFASGAAIERHTASSETRLALHHAEAGTQGENPAGAEPQPAAKAPNRQPAAKARHARRRAQPRGPARRQPGGDRARRDAVVVSLLLAVLILTVGSPPLAAVVVLAMLAFTALDIREVIHQLHESHPGLAALAATVALLHMLADAAALLVTRGARSQSGGISAA